MAARDAVKNPANTDGNTLNRTLITEYVSRTTNIRFAGTDRMSWFQYALDQRRRKRILTEHTSLAALIRGSFSRNRFTAQVCREAVRAWLRGGAKCEHSVMPAMQKKGHGHE